MRLLLALFLIAFAISGKVGGWAWVAGLVLLATALLSRCPMCHTAEPVWEGVYEAPKNVILDNDVAIANWGHEIAIQAGYSHAMPPGNVTEMTAEERAAFQNCLADKGFASTNIVLGVGSYT